MLRMQLFCDNISKHFMLTMHHAINLKKNIDLHYATSAVFYPSIDLPFYGFSILSFSLGL